MHVYYKKKKFFNKKLYESFKNNFQNKFDELIINGNDIIQSSVVIKKKFIKKSRLYF